MKSLFCSWKDDRLKKVMKVAPKLVFLFRDPDGFGSAIVDAIQPNPNSSHRRVEETVKLSLERYGVKDQTACGVFYHFVNDDGDYQESVLLMENYELPVLVCALNEFLGHIVAETPSQMPTLVVPFFIPSTKRKLDRGTPSNHENVTIYGVQIGPDSNVSQVIAKRTQKPPSSLQIDYEPLACFLHLVRVLNLPTSVLIGLRNTNFSEGLTGHGHEVLHMVVEILADATCLYLDRKKLIWNPTNKLNAKEPWRTLYGDF